MDILGISLLVVGVLALLGIGIGAYLLKSKGGVWKWILGAVGALVTIVLGLVLVGRKRKSIVKEVQPHERKIAPTEESKIKLDVQSGQVKEEEKAIQALSTKLDKKTEELDVAKERLDEEATRTDMHVKEVEERKKNPIRTISSRKPDPDISDRIRRR